MRTPYSGTPHVSLVVHFLPSPGLQQMMLAALLFSMMTACAKLIGTSIPPAEIVLVRTVFSLAVTHALLRRRRLPVWGTHRWLLLARGAFGFVALMCLFFALPRLPLAEATLFQYLNPVFVAVLAIPFLGEKLSRVGALSLVGCVAGLLLVVKPSLLFGLAAIPLDALAVAAALTGAFFSSLAYLCIRRLAGQEAPLTIVFYLPLVSLPAAALLTWHNPVWPTGREWLLLLAIAVLTQLAQVALTKGLSLEPASRATTTGYLQVVFAALWGALLFDQFPDALSLAGAALILASVLLLTRQRQAVTGPR